jgi:hypothetical protein
MHIYVELACSFVAEARTHSLQLHAVHNVAFTRADGPLMCPLSVGRSVCPSDSFLRYPNGPSAGPVSHEGH